MGDSGRRTDGTTAPRMLASVRVVVVLALLAATSTGCPERASSRKPVRLAEGSLTTATLRARRAAPPSASESSATSSPHAIGESVLGRPIMLFSFGKAPRRVLIVGGVHGDEYGADVAEAFATYLGGHAAAIPKGTQVDIVPCANPDGVAEDRRGNAHHVNLNRNFPAYNWHPMMGPRTTSGPRPASEPETRAIIRQLEAGYACVISLHSSGGVVDFDGPGGLPLAERIARASRFRVLHLAVLGAYPGSLGSYVPQQYRIPVITVELRSRQLDADVLAGLSEALR